MVNGNDHRISHENLDSRRPYEYKIVDQLFHLPTGHHCLILYSNIESMRKVYASYIKKQMEEQPGSVVLFLSYYDTTENIRTILQSKGIQVKEQEKTGSIIILDIVKVLDNPFFEIPDIERLRELTRKLENQFKDKTIFVIADMSVFHRLNKTSELLEYEKNLHNDIKIERWKELCMYHKSDFQTMFTDKEANQLKEYHKDRIIIV
jgi:KaiC/GvpD/RAD55 family RecA-like ATPase